MRFRILFVGVAVMALVAAGCGDDDDGASSQEKYCEAGQTLEASVNTLSGLLGVGDDPIEEPDVGQIMDVVVESSDDLESAIDGVEADLAALREAANDAAADEIDALEQAMDGLTSAFSTLGSDLATDTAMAAAESVQGARSAAQAVYDTLTDCP